CNVFDQGQAEDYTLNILKENLAVSETGNKIKTAIYPNPAKDMVKIKTDSDLMTAEIFDMNGRIILSSSSKQIDISKISTGQYLIKSTFKDGSSDTQKLIKE
ncbi:MAG: T9SS type A sorting domain-containing protein, partial [Chryseobacterium sp.]